MHVGCELRTYSAKLNIARSINRAIVEPSREDFTSILDQTVGSPMTYKSGIGPEIGAGSYYGFPPMKADGRSTHAEESIHAIADRSNPCRVQRGRIDGTDLTSDRLNCIVTNVSIQPTFFERRAFA